MGYDGEDDTVSRVPAPARSDAPTTTWSAASGSAVDDVVQGDTIIPDRAAHRSDPGRSDGRRSSPQRSGGERPADRSESAPTRYRLRINGDRPVELDRRTIVGRRPGAARIPGRTEPRLVTVESPLHEVSSNHVEIVQDGGSVVVTDLRSTNGTTVTLPSSERVRLRPGESFVAVPGSLIDIGDGNVMEILTAERLLPADGWVA